MLGATIAAIMKGTTKLAIYPYIDKMVFTTAIAEYKLEVACSGPNIVTVVRIIGLPIKPSQIKVTTQSVKL